MTARFLIGLSLLMLAFGTGIVCQRAHGQTDHGQYKYNILAEVGVDSSSGRVETSYLWLPVEGAVASYDPATDTVKLSEGLTADLALKTLLRAVLNEDAGKSKKKP